MLRKQARYFVDYFEESYNLFIPLKPFLGELRMFFRGLPTKNLHNQGLDLKLNNDK